ncbi:MAG: M48 family metallopeptidase [Parasphingorhabdus sp.]|nr:M48 family metallopeptidase [Parasphingorhabdus sp.]
MKWQFFLGLSLLLATAAAAQPNPSTIATYRALQTLDGRVYSVGYRLLSANSRWCRNVSPSAGLLIQDAYQYGEPGAAQAALESDGALAVIAVAPGSSADGVGLKPGDTILRIGARSVDEIAGPMPAARPTEQRKAAVDTALAKALDAGSAALSISRAGTAIRATLVPQAICASQLQVDPSEALSASADGDIVTISSAMVEYAAESDELAAVLAHEISHNLLGHRARLDQAGVDRSFFGQFGNSAKRIRATEEEADRLSVWLMANAGYDPVAAIRFWTRFGKEHGKGIFSASTHNRWKKRVTQMQAEIDAIAKSPITEGQRAPPLLGN